MTHLTAAADDTTAQFRAIANDLALYELALAVTKGALRRRYVAQRDVCLAAIDVLALIDPETAAMSHDELLAVLPTEPSGCRSSNGRCLERRVM